MLHELHHGRMFQNICRSFGKRTIRLELENDALCLSVSISLSLSLTHPSRKDHDSALEDNDRTGSIGGRTILTSLRFDGLDRAFWEEQAITRSMDE